MVLILYICTEIDKNKKYIRTILSPPYSYRRNDPTLYGMIYTWKETKGHKPTKEKNNEKQK